jgi:hypothetical protein
MKNPSLSSHTAYLKIPIHNSAHKEESDRHFSATFFLAAYLYKAVVCYVWCVRGRLNFCAEEFRPSSSQTPHLLL